VDEDWMFQPIAFSFLDRIKVKITGAIEDNHKNKHFEGKKGIIDAMHSSQDGYKREVAVVFDDGTPREVFPRKYVKPIEASRNGEEALAMDGPGEVKGRVVLLRANAESIMVEVSPKGDPSVYEVTKTALLALKEV